MYRDFVERHYVDLKKKNPSVPFLIRECSGVQPVIYGRYGNCIIFFVCMLCTCINLLAAEKSVLDAVVPGVSESPTIGPGLLYSTHHSPNHHFRFITYVAVSWISFCYCPTHIKIQVTYTRTVTRFQQPVLSSLYSRYSVLIFQIEPWR